ncbi:MAG TPA: glycoside hydrolase, partial [Bacilli bacterium]
TYNVPENNPIVISTKKDFNGLGHSSSVMGPDLDSYYIFYHNLVGRSAEGPPVRKLNMDRIVFNGNKMAVLGATHFSQPVPQMPDFYDGIGKPLEQNSWDVIASGNETRWLSSKIADKESFTAEFNFILNTQDVGDAEYSFETVFSYGDENNFRSVDVNPALQRIVMFEVKDGGRKQIGLAQLPLTMDSTKLHTIRVESDTQGTRIYFDQMHKLTAANMTAKPGKIGYVYRDLKPDLQFTAFSNEAGGSSDYETMKPVPGSIEAVHYLKEEERGFHIGYPAEGSTLREGDRVPIRISEDGSHAVSLEGKGDWVAYKINVQEAGTYGFDVMMNAEGNEVGNKSVLELKIDGESRRFELGEKNIGDGNLWVKKHIGKMELTRGEHTLTVKLVKGKLTFRFLNIYHTAKGPISIPNVFDHIMLDDMYGNWIKSSDGYAVQTEGSDAKMYAGSHDWTDYRVEVDVKSTADSLEEGGLLFRVTNESEYPDQVKDSFMGYQLTFRNGRMILKRMNYDQNEVASVPLSFATDSSVHIAVEVSGNTIKVYSNHSKQPDLEWTDANAWMHGRVGIRSASPTWVFANMSLFLK